MGAAPFIDHRRAGTISHAASSHLVVVELAQPRRWNDHLAGFDRLEDLPRAFREKAAQADIVLMAGVGDGRPRENETILFLGIQIHHVALYRQALSGAVAM